MKYLISKNKILIPTLYLDGSRRLKKWTNKAKLYHCGYVDKQNVFIDFADLIL